MHRTNTSICIAYGRESQYHVRIWSYQLESFGESGCMRRYVGLVRQVWLEDVVRVGFDAVKKKSSLVELNRSAMAGASPLQYPSQQSQA